MAAKESDGLFRRLTKLFRSGPVVKRKIRPVKGSSPSSAFDIFGKTQSHVYSTAMSAYGTYDRMARYSDFSEMEYTPEIASALDIYAEESAATDENGHVLHIHSENQKIKQLLEDLFFDTVNIEFNLTSWVRNLCKYGDFFLFNDVSTEQGVINVLPIPVNEIEREEGFDPKDPMAVRYRWVTQGNQVLENWQVTHFRLLGNDAFLPYGSSVLESARRIWRQLILVEDAMLVYRVVRSPERRVFKIDVGNVPPEDIPAYMEQVQTTLKRAQVVDKNTGRVDLRYNPLSVDEDYFLPVRGSESGTEITTLAGGQNTTAIEDVQYIQKKLFAALKIPRAYLGYDEGLGAKATLAQEDIRFSRAINKIQRTLISELNKVAIIHLYSYGFEGEDLLDFNLSLSNPSTVAQQQKLELFRSRFEIATSPPEGLVDRNFIRKTILGLTDKQIDDIEKGKLHDKLIDLQVEAVKLPVSDEEGEEGEDEEAGGEEEYGEEEGEEELAADDRNTLGLPVLTAAPTGFQASVAETDADDFDNIVSFSISDELSPVRAQNRIKKYSSILSEDSKKAEDNKKKNKQDDEKADEGAETEAERRAHNRNRKRKNPTRAAGLRATDDLLTLTNFNDKDPTGLKNIRNWTKHDPNPLKEEDETYDIDDESFFESFFNKNVSQQAKMTSDVRSTLKSLGSSINIGNNKVLVESLEEDEEIG